MAEPRLEDIEDYNTLKGSKRKVVLGVIAVGILIGVVYSFAYNKYDNADDNIKVEKSFSKIPMK